MPQVWNNSKFWIWQSSEYGRVLIMWALHSVLNMPEFALTEFSIYLGFHICQNSEYGRVLNMQGLHRVLHMPQNSLITHNTKYGFWIGREYAWICLNFLIMDRVLNMYHTINSVRSLYNLISPYWEIIVFRTRSMI